MSNMAPMVGPRAPARRTESPVYVNSTVPTSQGAGDVGDVEFTTHGDGGWRVRGVG